MRRGSRPIIVLAAVASAACSLFVSLGDLTSGQPTTDSGLPDGAIEDAAPGGDAATAPTCDADLANDENNCGRCQRNCFGGGCEAGLCGFVQVSSAQVRDLDYNNGTLYFSRQNGSDDGGGISAYVESSAQTFDLGEGLPGPAAITVSPPYLIWATEHSFPGARQLVRMLLDGGAATTLVGPSTDDVVSIASNSTNVFWIDNTSTQVDYAPIATGGSPTPFDSLTQAGTDDFAGIGANDAYVVVASANSVDQVVLSNNAVVAVPDLHPGLIVLSNNVVYFTDGSTIYRASLGSTVRTALATLPDDDGGAYIAGLAGDDFGVYWLVIEGNYQSYYGCSDTSCSAGPTMISPTRNCGSPSFVSDMVVSPNTVYINGVCDPVLGSGLFRITR